MNRHPPHGPDPNQPLDESGPGDIELEAAIRRLSLCAPSPMLETRMGRLFGRSRSSGRARTMLLAIAAGIALAGGTLPLIVSRLWHTPKLPVTSNVRPVGSPTPANARPLRVEQRSSRVWNDGVIATAEGIPIELIRYRSLRQVWYFDLKTGRRLQVTVPVSQAFLVPVRTF